MVPLLYSSSALAAVFAAYLATADAGARTPHRLLAATFVAIAALSLLAVVKLGAPDHPLAALRPVLAMALGPLLFLHLATAARGEARLRRGDLLHAAGPLVMAAALKAGFSGAIIDGLIVASVGGYAGAIALGAPRSAFAARGAAGAKALARWRRIVIAWMGLMAFADVAVAIELTWREALAQSLAFALSAASTAAFFAYALIMTLHRKGPLEWITVRMRKAAAPDAGGDLAARLESQMAAGAYLDPALTVARFARRLGEPARAVSETVNGRFGVTFTEWVNAYRIREAQRLIEADPAAGFLDILLASGFQTKSHFNKTFRDVTGLTPSDWRDKALAGEDAAPS